jgi:hypothetical protein
MTHARTRDLRTADPDPIELDLPNPTAPQIRPADSRPDRDGSWDPRRLVLDPVDCLRPVSPTVGRTASRSTTVSLSLARGLGSASGRRPAVRATSTTGSPQGGNQR